MDCIKYEHSLTWLIIFYLFMLLFWKGMWPLERIMVGLIVFVHIFFATGELYLLHQIRYIYQFQRARHHLTVLSLSQAKTYFPSLWHFCVVLFVYLLVCEIVGHDWLTFSAEHIKQINNQVKTIEELTIDELDIKYVIIWKAWPLIMLYTHI